MAYRVIKGKVAIDGKSPDGDTIAFRIDNPTEWIWPKTQDGRFPKFNMQYQTSIRFEAIDALELHYGISNVYPGVTVHQPLTFAKRARDRLLELFGFDMTNVIERDDFTLVDPMKQEKPAILAYNGIDPFGRIIGFVFSEDIGLEVSDREPMVELHPEHIEKSVNAKLLAEGLVYPTYYGGLYPELRKFLNEITDVAIVNKIGLWSEHSNEFVFSRQPNISDIESKVMMPKLFRRLSEHIAKNGVISNFRDALREGKDLTVDLNEVRLTDFSSFVRTQKINQNDYKLWLSHSPSRLVFVGG